jgi:hypothetical protein
LKKIAKVSLSEINVQDDYSQSLINALKKGNKQKNKSPLVLAQNKPKKPQTIKLQ